MQHKGQEEMTLVCIKVVSRQINVHYPTTAISRVRIIHAERLREQFSMRQSLSEKKFALEIDDA